MIKSLLTISLVQQGSQSGLLVIMERMTNIDSLEKAVKIMVNARDAMSNTAMESISYKESYNKDGISFDINGQGFVRNLKFANGTPPSMIENAINGTIEKMRLHFEEIYFNNLPLDMRQAVLDESQKMKAMLDMQQPKEP
jgi:hypothetical protein